MGKTVAQVLRDVDVVGVPHERGGITCPPSPELAALALEGHQTV
jgi:hypothetical protein